MVYGGPYATDETNPGDSSVVAAFPANERDHRAEIGDWKDETHSATNGRHAFRQGTVADRDAYTIEATNAGDVFFHPGMIAVRNAANSAWVEFGILTTGDVKQSFYNPTSPPEGWLPCDGAAVSRSTYSALFTKLTLTRNGDTHTNITVDNLSSTEDLYIGMKVEGTGIQAGTTIATIAGANSITLSLAATGTATVSLRFFNVGSGDGSTTFNTPDFAGKVAIGWKSTGDADNEYGGIGQGYGSKKHTLSIAEMPAHDHVGSVTVADGAHIHAIPTDSGNSGTTFIRSGNGDGTNQNVNGGADGAHAHGVLVASQGGGGVHENRQPSLVLGMLVKT